MLQKWIVNIKHKFFCFLLHTSISYLCILPKKKVEGTNNFINLSVCKSLYGTHEGYTIFLTMISVKSESTKSILILILITSEYFVYVFDFALDRNDSKIICKKDRTFKSHSFLSLSFNP